MEETLCVTKAAIADLARLTHEINERVESLELMGDREFMDSLKKSDEQVKKREFVDWDAL